MSDDPWSRPTLQDLQDILGGIEKVEHQELRNANRLDLSVPAEIMTSRGNTIDAMTREISMSGVGLFHRGSLSPGQVTVRMASDSRTYEYRVTIEWCYPCENGMFMSGGRFVKEEADAS